ncbi:MAG: UDP-N-acetylmuramate--L-alanine ligase, partial [Oscillospiraceae bacterium]|nr:UDP-N-acetylmuramate--L-alanine ligase [Oscillospiraceae bacterium]
PTVMIGGTLPLLNAGHRVGKGDTIVLESCEYYNSFHSFFPTVAVILNVDTDHLDFFKSFANIKASFGKFASLVPEDGYVVVNYDDSNAMDVVSWRQKRVITFGLGEGADVRGVNIVVKGIMSEFDILYKGELFTHVRLSLVGQHNIYNALAASSAAIALGIPAEFISEGLSLFRGAKRRFEFKGRVNGADVFDDYAHHPSELHALLDAACSLDYKRVIVAFQPHTYSRTQAHFDSFVSELKRADVAFLAEIYAAREQNTIGISSKQLADAVPGAEYYSDFAELEARLRGFAREGDIIVTVGAGDIYKVGEAIV